MNDGYAVLTRGPEDGGTVYVGRNPPPRIDFVSEDGTRVARYVRCTRLQFDAFRSRGCGHTGQTTYRFRCYVELAETL
jgi:hypothetical protein